VSFGTDPILGPQGAGVLGSDGKLTPTARAKFVTDIVSVVANGNQDGTGIKYTGFLPLPIFPSAGPKVILDPLRPDGENLFWFKAEPLALATLPILSDPNKEFQKLIVTGLYEPLVQMLNLNGDHPLFPVFDPTCVIDLGKFPNIQLGDIPSILAKLAIQFAAMAVPSTLPAAKIKLAVDFGISDLHIADTLKLLVPPVPPKPPLPPIPSIPIPLVPVPKAGIATPNFPDLALGVFKIPTALFPQLITLVISPSIDPPALLLKIIGLIVDAILTLLQALGLLTGLPKLLLATMMVIVKDLAVMLLCVVIGRVLGTGALVKIIATLGGLA
jgi:hypothetical protein